MFNPVVTSDFSLSFGGWKPARVSVSDNFFLERPFRASAWALRAPNPILMLKTIGNPAIRIPGPGSKKAFGDRRQITAAITIRIIKKARLSDRWFPGFATSILGRVRATIVVPVRPKKLP